MDPNPLYKPLRIDTAVVHYSPKELEAAQFKRLRKQTYKSNKKNL